MPTIAGHDLARGATGSEEVVNRVCRVLNEGPHDVWRVKGCTREAAESRAYTWTSLVRTTAVD